MFLGQYDIDAMQNRLEEADNASGETAYRRPLIVTKDNARSALMTKLNRSGAMVSGSGAKRTVRRGVMTRGNSFAGMRFGQHVVVKIRYVKHKKIFAGTPALMSGRGQPSGVGGLGGAGSSGAGRSGSGRAGGGASVLRSHVKYISRGEAGKDGERAVLFGATETGVDAEVFVAACDADRHHWRFIISPENGHQIEDFHGYVRGIMGKVESDLGTKLEWVSAVHYDTDNPHAHVIIRGKNDKEQDLVIGQDYIKEGIRRRAQEVAAELLDERSLEEIQQSLAADVDKLRVTSLDRFIEKRANQDKERKVDVRKKHNFDKSLFYEGLIKGRLKFLSTAGLANEKPPGVFTLKEGYKETLAQVAQKNDIIKQLHKKGLESELDGLSIYSIKVSESQMIEGRVVAKGIADEHTDRQYLIIRDAGRKHHYVPFGEFKEFDELEKGALVKVVPGGQSSGNADYNLLREAKKNLGVYDPEKHLAAIVGYIPETDRERYIGFHQIRLTTLEKNGIVKDLGEGRYEISEDVVERGAEVTREINIREDKRFYPKLEVLSKESPSKLVDAEKNTWLDKELALQAKGKPSLSAYDEATSKALEKRKAWLVEHDLGDISPDDGQFRLRKGTFNKLDTMELHAAGNFLGEKLGFEFDDTINIGVGERWEYHGYVTLETGVWGVASKGKSLLLAPLEEVPTTRRGTEVVFEATDGDRLRMRERVREQERDRGMEL